MIITPERDIYDCLDNLEDAWIPKEFNHLDSVEIKNTNDVIFDIKPSSRKKNFSFTQRRNGFSKHEAESSNDKSIFDYRRRPSKKAEDIITDVKRYLNKSLGEETLNHADSYSKLKINVENEDYVDIFSDDKNFHVDEYGWVTLANEHGSKNNVKLVFQKIRKSCSLAQPRLRV